MNFSNKSAFTLVELIVVITILAILGTVGFLSLQGYSSSARDSARLSDLANLSKAMDAQLAAGKLLPQPNAPMLTLTASGTAIGYQGCAGSGALGALGLSPNMDDPLNGTCYTYETNAAQNKYQVLSLQENASQATAMGIPLVDTAYAGPYDTRIPSTRGSQLGILLGTGANLNQPAQEMYNASSFTGIDIVNTATPYVAYFSNSDRISGTGAWLGSLKASMMAANSLFWRNPSLIGYWDMETTAPDGRLIDLSGNWNSGTSSGGLIMGSASGNGNTGKATQFTGPLNSIALNSDITLSSSVPWTVSAWVKTVQPGSSSPGGEQSILSNSSGWPVGNSLGIGTWKIVYWHYNNAWIGDYGTSAVNTGNWVFLTWVMFGNDTMNMYVNGVLENGWFNSRNPQGPVNSIGHNWYAGMTGTIDELRIYNRALSASEVQSLYNSTR